MPDAAAGRTGDGPPEVPAEQASPHSSRVAEHQVQRLTFRGSHLSAVQAGTKRCTMRFEDPMRLGPALLVFELPEPVALSGRIMSAVTKRVVDVTEQEARADGFASAAAVLLGLRDYYPGLRGDDEIVILTFEVDGPDAPVVTGVHDEAGTRDVATLGSPGLGGDHRSGGVSGPNASGEHGGEQG